MSPLDAISLRAPHKTVHALLLFKLQDMDFSIAMLRQASGYDVDVLGRRVRSPSQKSAVSDGCFYSTRRCTVFASWPYRDAHSRIFPSTGTQIIHQS